MTLIELLTAVILGFGLAFVCAVLVSIVDDVTELVRRRRENDGGQVSIHPPLDKGLPPRTTGRASTEGALDDRGR